MLRSHRSSATLSRALIALLAIAALLPGVFEHHGPSHAHGHGVHAHESLEVSAVAHPGQSLHIEATEMIHIAGCPACLHAQNPSLLFDLAPLAGRGGLRGVLASPESLALPRRELGGHSARAPPQA